MKRLIPIFALLLACDAEPASPSELELSPTPAADVLADAPDAADAPNASGALATPPTEQILQVHWRFLPSFDDVLRHSQIVVRGEVIGTSLDAIRHPDIQDPSVHSDLPITISSFVVREVLLGTIEANDAVSEAIEVQELGGRMSDGAFAYPDDKPPLRPGDEVVLCLAAGANGRYSVIGGTQGRFGLVAGKLDPLYTGEDFARFEGAPLERLTAAIAAFKAAPR